MDSMQEERELHDAISDAISRPANEMFDDVSKAILHFYGSFQWFNDLQEELLNELNELEALEEEELVVSSPAAPVPTYELPSVPTSAVKVNTSSLEWFLSIPLPLLSVYKYFNLSV